MMHAAKNSKLKPIFTSLFLSECTIFDEMKS